MQFIRFCHFVMFFTDFSCFFERFLCDFCVLNHVGLVPYEPFALYGFMHSTGGWKGNAEVLYDKGIPLNELISCREDVYAYLYDKLNGKCCENPSGQVYDIKESVRKGKYSNNRMPAEIEKLLLECDVPEWYIGSMKKILYLFPKTHLIVLLKRDICKYIVMNNS